MLEWLKAILGDSYTEEIDRRISAEIGKAFVSKADFNTVNEAKKSLDRQLEAAGGNDQLKSTILQLQSELAQLKLDSKLDAALAAAGARNVKTVRALLDLSKVKAGEDGVLQGLEEQLNAVRASDGYLFAETQQSFKGFQPGASKDGVPDPEQGGFEARLASARKCNNQLEVIKIKQEAAANGVLLL